jgi:hypothetical protein
MVYMTNMNTLNKSDRTVFVTGVRSPVQVPLWARGFKPRAMTIEQIRAAIVLPEITIVRGRQPSSLLAHHVLVEHLAAMQKTTKHPAMILIEFGEAAAHDPDELAVVLERFPDPRSVELAWGAKSAAATLAEAFAKLLVSERKAASDPLGEVRGVIEATAGLRSESGRLSARKIAETFGISLAELAERILGKKRQTVAKTDDAESLQAGLQPLEHIARLRTVLDVADFCKWLRMSNTQLDGETPLEVIRQKEAQTVADLAHDMLVGNPT